MLVQIYLPRFLTWHSLNASCLDFIQCPSTVENDGKALLDSKKTKSVNSFIVIDWCSFSSMWTECAQWKNGCECVLVLVLHWHWIRWWRNHTTSGVIWWSSSLQLGHHWTKGARSIKMCVKKKASISPHLRLLPRHLSLTPFPSIPQPLMMMMVMVVVTHVHHLKSTQSIQLPQM